MCAPSRRIFKEKYLQDRERAGAIPESLPKAVSLIILSHFDDMMEEKKKMGKPIEVWKKKKLEKLTHLLWGLDAFPC